MENDININIEMLQKNFAEFYEFEPNALVFKKQWVAAAAIPAGAAAPGGPPGATVPTEIKIYTGVIANGTLGTPSEFISRPDDMIQNTEELRQAANINLAAFVQALPGNFYYEIGIVSSVKTRSGFTQRGAAARVVTGYYRSGLPRYKTIYHKFAVMKIGVFDENRRTVKLGTIVLGPVNSVDFQPTAVELGNITSAINTDLFTSSVDTIKEIITTQPIVSTPVATPPPPPPAPSAPAAPSVAPPAPSAPPPAAPVEVFYIQSGTGAQLTASQVRGQSFPTGTFFIEASTGRVLQQNQI